MEELIKNRVKLSGILTLDLMQYKPTKDQYLIFDLVPFLFHEYLLQEKNFRAEMLAIDWSRYSNKEVILCCSNDAIVPYWAYVYVASLLSPYTDTVLYADQRDHQELLWAERIKKINYTFFKDKKVVLKASSMVPPDLFVLATSHLMQQVQSLMWGEAGAPVRIYKRNH